MAIGDIISEVESAIKKDDYTRALELLKEVDDSKTLPKSSKFYLLRSKAYHMTKQYDLGLQDAEVSLKLSIENGKRESVGLAYFEIAIIYYKVKLYHKSQENLLKSEEYNPGNNELPFWKGIIDSKIQKNGGSNPANTSTTTTATSTTTTNTISTPVTQPEISKPSNVPQKIRTDWYDSKSIINLSIYVKKIPEDSLSVEFKPFSINIKFQNNSQMDEFKIESLFQEIDVEKSSYKLFGTKLEVYLHKKDGSIKWTHLSKEGKLEEETVINYPSSSKKTIDWNSLDKELSEDLEKESQENDDPNAFFKQLYASADEDTKRAMMKSYIESNGTSLSTDWEDVSKGTVETVPPEGSRVVKY